MYTMFVDADHLRVVETSVVLDTMMQDSGENTPLLRRTRRFQETRGGGPFLPFSQRDTSRYSDADDGKHDRRSFFAQALAALHQSLQVSSLKLVPPMDDESNYEDTYNDEPWKCTCGTDEDDGVWMNQSDRAGTLMACMVWVLISYSCVTILILVRNHHMPVSLSCIYCTISALALASHAKTSLSDPGSVPSSAIPVHTKGVPFHAMCSICQTYKPKNSHHCRICNRCISRMDHHCPWMNNCIGAANMKHFILFLVYTWTGSAMAILVFSVNYFFCRNDRCEFSGTEVHLVRAMTWLCVGSLLFTSSMLMNVVYGILTGIGTIDRLKKKASDTWQHSTEEAIPLKHIFGVGPLWTWCIPTDPTFEDYDFIMGYTTRHRLLRQREQQQEVASSVATQLQNDQAQGGRAFDESTIDV